jgi:pimeloyl-ACP methyl ester carboxylesterase
MIPRAYHREAGTGPAVMCLHASAGSSAQWRPLMDHLGGRFRIVAVDLYGSGKSPRWPDDRPLSLADEVAQLTPILESADDRVHLVGHSYGGAVALKTALCHPERIRSLILFEPVLFSQLFAEDPAQPAAQEIAAVRDETIAAVARGAGSASGERFVDYWMGAGAWAGTPEPRRDAVATAMSAVVGQWNAAFTEPAPLEAFSALEMPILYLIGSDSPASSLGVARLLLKALPRVTEVEIEGVGHMAPVTHPDRVNALIERHLESA